MFPSRMAGGSQILVWEQVATNPGIGCQNDRYGNQIIAYGTDIFILRSDNGGATVLDCYDTTSDTVAWSETFTGATGAAAQGWALSTDGTDVYAASGTEFWKADIANVTGATQINATGFTTAGSYNYGIAVSEVAATSCWMYQASVATTFTGKFYQLDFDETETIHDVGGAAPSGSRNGLYATFSPNDKKVWQFYDDSGTIAARRYDIDTPTTDMDTQSFTNNTGRAWPDLYPFDYCANSVGRPVSYINGRSIWLCALPENEIWSYMTGTTISHVVGDVISLGSGEEMQTIAIGSNLYAFVNNGSGLSITAVYKATFL